jgi:hypothetical protein
MARKTTSKGSNTPSSSRPGDRSGIHAPDEDYKVGPGRPPKQHQWKKGQSGNPKGAKRKNPSMEQDLKAALKRALNNKVKLTQGEKQRTVTLAEAGIEQLVAGFAKGDRHARRDLIALADRIGVNLFADHTDAVELALASHHQALLAAYVARQSGVNASSASPPVFAPPDLADSDSED